MNNKLINDVGCCFTRSITVMAVFSETTQASHFNSLHMNYYRSSLIKNAVLEICNFSGQL
jgi:hypothetical protein